MTTPPMDLISRAVRQYRETFPLHPGQPDREHSMELTVEGVTYVVCASEAHPRWGSVLAIYQLLDDGELVELGPDEWSPELERAIRDAGVEI